MLVLFVMNESDSLLGVIRITGPTDDGERPRRSNCRSSLGVWSTEVHVQSGMSRKTAPRASIELFQQTNRLQIQWSPSQQLQWSLSH